MPDTSSSLRILQFCFRLPYPPNDGGAIAMYNLTKGFSDAGCDLTIFSYNTKKHYFDTNELPEEFKKFGKLYTVNLDASVRPIGAFLNLFTRKSYNISRFDKKEIRGELKALLASEKFDIIHFEGLFTSMYVDLISELVPESKLVLRQHNIEYKIWERMAKTARFPKKWYLSLLAKRLKKYELTVLSKFDAIVPITEVDEKFCNEHNVKNTFVSPTGLEVDDYKRDIKPESSSVFHLGALNWKPNEEGLRWFLSEIWPRVYKERPVAKFYIAGRDIPDWVADYHEKSNIFVVGEVEDAVDFYHSKEVMVVPLLSGSGMRIKIIEGMAAAKPIVATEIGAEGISVIDGRHLKLADDSKNFAQKVIELLDNKEEAQKIGKSAQQFVASEYSNKMRVAQLLDYYKSLMN